MGVYRSDVFWGRARKDLLPRSLDIVSMSPPGYPSAWLHPCRARFRFPWQSHCKRLRARHLACRLLPANLSPPARLFQLAVARRLDLLLPARQHVHGRHVADSTVQAHIVVVIDVLLDSAVRHPARVSGVPGRMHSLLAIYASAPAYRSIADSKARFSHASYPRSG